MAGQVDALYIYLLLVSGVMTALIFLAVTLLAIKYRRSTGRDAQQIEGSTLLEITWSIIPLFVMMTFFVWGAVIYFQERTPPADATEVYVVAKQWMWKIEHMEGQREINELHVPTGQNIKLIMTSQDVIHSFYVPAFRIKQDVLPGRYTTLWFKATKPGRYHLFCAEYCGTQHSGMGGDIVVMEPQDYAQWMAGGPSAPLQDTGKQLFSSLGCATCHRFDVQGRGPNLQGIYNKPVLLEDGRTVIADENYVRESILNPTAKIVNGFKPVMPTFQGIVSDEQLNALVAYVKSLGQPATGTAGLQNPPAASSGTTPEYAGAIVMASRVIPANQAPASTPKLNYLNNGHTLKSWLLTTDHKRIAILYLISVTVFFFLGGFFAMLIRLELLTPQGDLMQADTYNKVFTMHGMIMVFFFLIPVVPAVLGNFLVPLMIGAKDLAFPRINLLSWYLYVHRRHPDFCTSC